MDKKRVIISGGTGMLGSSISTVFHREGHEVLALTKQDMNILDPQSTQKKVEDFHPDIFINCAAFTAVDKCETEKIAFHINGDALKPIARICKERNIKLIHFSTDYVFSGNFQFPIPEDTPTNPVNLYGEGKLAGERHIIQQAGLNYLIFRIQWLYGKNGKNFVDTMLRIAKSKPEVRVVNDQLGRPTSTNFIAEVVYKSITNNLSGVYHIGPKNFCSWYDFASYILKNTNCKVVAIPSVDYPTPAKRPTYSVLGLEKIYNAIPDPIFDLSWEKLLDQYLDSL